MRTIQGAGTALRGWHHQPDGTSLATLWIVLFFMPIIPLRRYRLRVLTDFKAKEPFATVPDSGFFAGSLTGVQIDRYQFLEQTPLAVREIAETLLCAYVFGPVLMVWPVSLFFALHLFLEQRPALKQSSGALYLFVVLFAASFGNAIAVPLIALRRARGFRGGLFE